MTRPLTLPELKVLARAMCRTLHRTAADRRGCVFSSGYLRDVLDYLGVPCALVPVTCAVTWPSGDVTPFPRAQREGWSGHVVLQVELSGLQLVDTASGQIAPGAPETVVSPIPHPLADGPVSLQAGPFRIEYRDGSCYGGREHWDNPNHVSPSQSRNLVRRWLGREPASLSPLER